MSAIVPARTGSRDEPPASPGLRLCYDERDDHLFDAEARVNPDMPVPLFVRQPVLDSPVVPHHQRVVAHALLEPRVRSPGAEPTLLDQHFAAIQADLTGQLAAYVVLERFGPV